jgi:hypothetical protein
MKHGMKMRKLSRTSSHRSALLRYAHSSSSDKYQPQSKIYCYFGIETSSQLFCIMSRSRRQYQKPKRQLGLRKRWVEGLVVTRCGRSARKWTEGRALRNGFSACVELVQSIHHKSRRSQRAKWNSGTLPRCASSGRNT